MAGPRKSVNAKLLVLLVGAVAALVAVIFVINRIQVRRNAESLVKLARAKRAEGRSQESIELFDRYLLFRPNDAEAHAEHARLRMERAQGDGTPWGVRWNALQALDTAVRKNPEDLDLRKRLAQLQLQFRRYAEAGQEIDIIRERLPSLGGADAGVDEDELSLMRAQAHAGNGHYPQAAEEAARVLGFDLGTNSFEGDKATNPSTLGASIVLAELLTKRLKDPETAGALLRRAVITCADDHRAWVTLAMWQRERGDIAGAAECAHTAVGLAPDDKDVLFLLFDVATSQQQFAEAEEAAAKLRKLFPEDERVYRAIAAAAVRQGKVDQALDVLRSALKRRDDLQLSPGEMLLMMGDLHLQQQNFPEVESVIGEYNGLYGRDVPASAMLEARLLIAQQKWLPATRKLESIRPLVAAEEQFTRQVDILLGQCHERLGQYDEQLAANRRVLSEEYDSVIARVGVAEALLGSGKPDEALAELETIAGGMPAERLAGLPQVWKPLLRLRIDTQGRRPPGDRDWSLVDNLIGVLERSSLVSASEFSLIKADASTRRGNLAAAVGTLRREVERNPAHVQAWAGLAMVTLRSEGVDAATAALEAAPDDLQDSPQLLMVRVQLAMQADEEQRTAAFARAEARAGELPAADAGPMLGGLAMMQRALGRPREAQRLLAAATRCAPDDLKCRTMRFEMACEEGDVENAAACAQEISRLAGATSPTGRVATAAAHILQVRVRRAQRARTLGTPESGLEPDDTEQQLLTEANVQLILAENERPGWAQIQQLFAEVATLRGENAEAIDRLQRAVALGLTSPPIIRQLVTLLYTSNRLADAQLVLAKLGGDGALGLERLSAELEMSAGQFEGAVSIAERSLADASRLSVSDLLWFGQVLARAGKPDRAVEVFERARGLEPLRSESWLALFATQLASGQRQVAEQTLERAVETLSPPSRQLVEAQGHEMLGRYDEAEHCFRDGLAVAPKDIAVNRSLASYLIRRGRLAAARVELERMIALPENDAAATAMRVWARRSLAAIVAEPGTYRDVERARKLLEENLATTPRPAAEDLAQLVALLAPRPEPDCWRRGLDALEQLAAIQPLSTAQRLERARLLDHVGNWEGCRKELLDVVSSPAATPEHLEQFVGRLIEHGELQSATTWLESFERRQPDDLKTAALRARIAMARNDTTAALAAARKLMPDQATSAGLDARLATAAPLMESIGFATAAESLFARWADLSPQGLLARAEFLGRQQRADDALDLLEAYRDRFSPQRFLQTCLAVLHALGPAAQPQHFDRVDRWLTKAIREDQDAMGLLLLLADLRVLTGREEEAVSLYRDLLRREGLTPFLRAIVANNLAFQLAQPETVAEATRCVELAEAELGPHPDVLDTRGVVLLAAGQPGAAVDVLSEAVLDRTPTKCLHLACALAADRQIESAKRALTLARKRGLDIARLGAHDAHWLQSLETAVGVEAAARQRL